MRDERSAGAPAAAAKSFIQGNIHQNGSGTSTTCAVTLAATVGSGNALCVSVSYTTAVIDSISVTDDKGNSYTSVISALNSGSGYAMHLFVAVNLTNAPQTITATDNSGPRQFLTIMVDEFSGASSLDGSACQAQSQAGTGTDAITSGPYTTTHNGDIIWGAGISISGTNMSVGTGFTVAGMNNVVSTFTTEWEIQSTASASTAATFTDGGALDQTVAGSLALS